MRRSKSISPRLHLLPIALAFGFVGCFADVDLDAACPPDSPGCEAYDFDGDGVVNSEDGHPEDPSCSVQDDDNCTACGVGCEGMQTCFDGECRCFDGTAGWTGPACDVCPSNWAGAACETCAASWSGSTCEMPASAMLSAGHRHTCALTFEGRARCWGLDSEGQSSPPEGAFIALSSGSWHTCGL
ncbi:MAG: hypothetical protein ACPGU1_16615, partial [Myxococcota bacterium]